MKNYAQVGLHVQKLCTGWFTRSEIMYRLVYAFRNYVQIGLHVQKLCTGWFTRSEIMYNLVYTFRNYVQVGLHVQKLCTCWFTRSKIMYRLVYTFRSLHSFILSTMTSFCGSLCLHICKEEPTFRRSFLLPSSA